MDYLLKVLWDVSSFAANLGYFWYYYIISIYAFIAFYTFTLEQPWTNAITHRGAWG